MSIVIDRSKTNTNKSAGNQKRFSDRHKQKIRRAIEDKFISGDFKGIQDGNGIDITIDSSDLEEYTFAHDTNTGISNDVVPGNPGIYNGDQIGKPRRQGGGSGKGKNAGSGEDSEDDFVYHLNEAEFRDMLFEYLELPALIKKSLKNTTKVTLERAGFRTTGTPSQLSVIKSYFNSFGRRLILEDEFDILIEATKTKKEKERLQKEKEDICLFEDSDLRFKNYEKNPVKIHAAVMFCVMDVSGSMSENLKNMSKRFFYMLYLFLRHKYTTIELRFVSHTETAYEVTEDEFFHGRRTGGTLIKPAYELVANIIKTEYNTDEYNIYVAQCTDGDCFGEDEKNSINFLQEELLHNVQYFAYLEVCESAGLQLYRANGSDYLKEIKKIKARNLQSRIAFSPSELFDIFVDLFKKE